MVASVAVLSDVHGVDPVLEAVLAEPDVRAADRVVVTGDHAAGPQPVEVLDRLTALGDRVVLVRGNADRELVGMARGGPVHPDHPEDGWAAAQLRPDQVDLLAGLPHPVTIDVDGFGPVLFCHGTPGTTRRSCSSTPAPRAGPRPSLTCLTRSGRSSAATPTCRSCASSTAAPS